MAEVGGIAGERLRSLVERIERLLEDRAAINNDIREVYAEGKAAGFDVKIMRQLIRLRQMEEADRDEQETMLDLYRRAIGMEAGSGQSDQESAVFSSPPDNGG